MRIGTRLKTIAAASGVTFALMALALVGSFEAFKDAKTDYKLANDLKTGFLVRASIRDQYFLHREPRLASLWDENKADTDRLLLQAPGMVHDAKDERDLEAFRQALAETANLFHRLVANTLSMAKGGASTAVYEELDKRLYSQLLLKAGIVRDSAMALEASSARRVERAYQRLAIMVGLFAVGLALVSSLMALQIAHFIRRRLVPLHAGAKAVAGGDFSYRLQEGTSDELAELAQSFNAMTERIQAFTQTLKVEILERKRLEGHLRDSESRLRESILSSPIPIMVHAEDGEVLLLSQAWTDLTGYGLADIPTTRIWAERAFGEHSDEIKIHIRQLFELPGVRKGGLYEVRTAAGELRKWDFQSQPLKSLPDLRRVVLSLAIDVTDQLELQEALRAGEARYRVLFEQSSLGMSILDLTAGRYLAVNPRMSHFYGWTKEELLGMPFRTCSLPEDAHLGADEIQALLDGSRSAFQVVKRFARKDGGCFWGDLHVVRLPDEPGQSPRAFSMLEDITEQKQAQDQLRQIMREQEIILAHANVGISLTIDRRQAWINDWMVETFQYSREEQEGQTTRKLYPTQEAYDQLGRDAYPVIAAEGSFQSVQRLLRKDGQPLWIHYNGRAVEPSDPGQGTLWILTDVTDKKLAEDALRESEALYRSLFELSPDAICLMRMRDKVVLEVNPAWEQMFKCTREEALGRATTDLGLRTDSEARSAFYRELELAKRLPIGTATLNRRNGSSFEAQFAASLIELDGEPVALLVLRDMSDEIALRTDMARQAVRYATVMATARDAIHVIDRTGRLREWNPAFLAHLGYSEQEAGDLNIADWDTGHLPGDLPRLITALVESPRNFDTQHRRKDGTLRNVEINASAIFLEGEEMLLASARDITDRKLAEAAREEALDRLQKIASRVPGVVYQYRLRPDGSSCFPFASEGLRDIFRIGPEEVREDAAKVFTAVHPEDRAGVGASIQASARGLTPWRHEFRVLFEDGTTRTLLGSSIPQREPDDSVLWHGFATDITERKVAEEALRQMNQTLEQRVAAELAHRLDQERMLVHQSRLAAMGEMVANIAHQWRQPLNALAMIQANLGDAHRHHDLSDDYLLDALHQANELVQKMSMTITDFLDFFRPDKAPTGFSMARQAQEALKLVRPGLAYHGISVDIQEGGTVWALGHPNEFSQVLLNLFSNARDSIQSAGIREGRIRISFAREGDRACLCFSDNGRGIQTEPIERIFEPYFTDKSTGTGLGLYMCRMIMERSMNGTIEAENVGDGARFTLHLPLAEHDHDPEPS